MPVRICAHTGIEDRGRLVQDEVGVGQEGGGVQVQGFQVHVLAALAATPAQEGVTVGGLHRLAA